MRQDALIEEDKISHKPTSLSNFKTQLWYSEKTQSILPGDMTIGKKADNYIYQEFYHPSYSNGQPDSQLKVIEDQQPPFGRRSQLASSLSDAIQYNKTTA
jgi:hypothetical protein